MKLTLALDRYDRHMPLFLGMIDPPDGVTWEMQEVGMVPERRHGINRHHRMLVDQEFDVCEVSLASYLIARQRGVRITAVPVFPRRLFSQNHIYVNAKAGIRSPRDLIGKRVGVWAFQVTMSVLARGDLKYCYDVPWERINWVTDCSEEIPLPHVPLPISHAPENKDISRMLVDGEIDALISPHPSAIVQDSGDRVHRLFPNATEECKTYYRRYGYCPIMHLLAIKEDVADALPDFPQQMIQIWEASKQQAYDFYHDPGYALLAFARNEYESQVEALGRDLWPSGFTANQANLDRFIDYMIDQQLLSARPPVETLFHCSVLNT